MLGQRMHDKVRLYCGRETGEPHKNHSGMKEPLPENQLAKILVFSK